MNDPRLIASGRDPDVFELADGRVLRRDLDCRDSSAEARLPGWPHEHGYPVMRLAVSPDGSRIATASGTWGELRTAVKIWAAPAPPR